MSDIESHNSSNFDVFTSLALDMTPANSLDLDVNSDESSVEDRRRRFLFEGTIIIFPELQKQNFTCHNISSPAVLKKPGDRYCNLYSIHTEGAIMCVPIILQTHLIPGEIWPVVSGLRNYNTIFQLSLNYHLIGFCYTINENNRTFGTTAIIYDHSLIIHSKKFEVIGQQRFEVLEVLYESDEFVGAQIKIIKDIVLTNPYNKLCLNPMKHILGHSKMSFKRDMWQTQWPAWVYNQFDVHELASRISKKVQMLCKNIEISEYDPTFLSFLVTRLGIFSETVISKLLSIESTNLRLQYELQYLNDLKVVEEYKCASSRCGAQVCSLNNVLPMSPTKSHESNCKYWRTNRNMITVSDLDDNVDLITFGSESTECYCFPGYKSTSIFCRRCKSHLGWSFVIDSNMSLTPMLFYALSETALIKMSVLQDS